MHRVPLKEYKMPRILAFDFTESEVKKIINAGFDTKRGASGLYDNNEFCIPSALQDIEIALIKFSHGTFSNLNERIKNKKSTLEKLEPRLLVEEVWGKGGWSIIFVNNDTSPEQLKYLGIENIGFGRKWGRYIPASSPEVLSHRIKLEFSLFRGETIIIEEKNPGELLRRFFDSGKWMLLASDEHEVKFLGEYVAQKWIIRDDSASPFALVIILYLLIPGPVRKTIMLAAEGQEIEVDRPSEYAGGILILPDFGNKNADVALNLIQDFVYEVNPSLFSEPAHEWLSDYRPAPVKEFYKKREEIETKKKKEIENINKKIEKEERKYSWLDMLLVGSDDDFRDSVGMALRFFDFKVKDIDKNLPPQKRKHEDFNIIDPKDNSFFIVEVKATKRGASEDFITKTQNHQGSYSRRNKCPIPDAILIVNHSSDLNPNLRSGRYYTDADVLARLKEQNIKAVDSISLHSLCQKVLEGKMKKEGARDFIKKLSGPISEEIKI